jgi:GNAT superfamily N-acetyltransferase
VCILFCQSSGRREFNISGNSKVPKLRLASVYANTVPEAKTRYLVMNWRQTRNFGTSQVGDAANSDNGPDAIDREEELVIRHSCSIRNCRMTPRVSLTARLVERRQDECNNTPAVSADAETCGRIIYDAFKNIADRHGFPPHFPTLETAIQRANFSITHPSIFGVVAESDGQIIGSNFLDERDPIRGLGPVTVDPSVQVHGVGRRLMGAVLERARGAVGVRLVQDSFNMLSISLYASLDFEVKEPLLLMRGKPNGNFLQE